MAQTVGTCGLRSCESELRCLQAFAQISLVFPTALSPTRTHLTNSWLVLSSSMLLAYCDFTEVFSVFLFVCFATSKFLLHRFLSVYSRQKLGHFEDFQSFEVGSGIKKSMWPMVVCFKNCFDPINVLVICRKLGWEVTKTLRWLNRTIYSKIERSKQFLNQNTF